MTEASDIQERFGNPRRLEAHKLLDHQVKFDQIYVELADAGSKWRKVIGCHRIHNMIYIQTDAGDAWSCRPDEWVMVRDYPDKEEKEVPEIKESSPELYTIEDIETAMRYSHAVREDVIPRIARLAEVSRSVRHGYLRRIRISELTDPDRGKPVRLYPDDESLIMTDFRPGRLEDDGLQYFVVIDGNCHQLDPDRYIHIDDSEAPIDG